MNIKPRKAVASHPGIRVSKTRVLTLFVSGRKKQRKVVPPELVRPLAQA